MSIYHAKRALEILRESGPVELYKSIYDFYCFQIKYKSKDITDNIAAQSNLLRKYVWDHRKKQLKDKYPNETDADPFKIIWVDPEQIRYVTGKIKQQYDRDSKHLDHFRNQNSFDFVYGAVRGGDWDTYRDKFTELWEYKAISQRYKDGVPWIETDFYKIHLKNIEEHGQSYFCRNKKELLQKCKEYELLLQDIKENGFKTQQEQGKLRPTGEIKVNIGRDGKILFNGGGRHRLSIAKVLNLDKVPVNVKVRHTLWQELRDDVCQNGLSEEHEEVRDHPDLQDIIN